MLLPWNAEFSSIQFWDEHYSSPFTHDHLYAIAALHGPTR